MNNFEIYQLESADSLYRLGVKCIADGKFDDALNFFQDSIKIFRSLYDSQGDIYAIKVADCLLNFGIAYSKLCMHNKAVEATREATSLYRTLCTDEGQSHWLSGIYCV